MTLKLTFKAQNNIETEPIYIDDDNMVEWETNNDNQQLQLLGFVRFPSTVHKNLLDVDYQLFRSQYFHAIDKYPVFLNEQGEWIVSECKVMDIQEV